MLCELVGGPFPPSVVCRDNNRSHWNPFQQQWSGPTQEVSLEADGIQALSLAHLFVRRVRLLPHWIILPPFFESGGMD